MPDLFVSFGRYFQLCSNYGLRYLESLCKSFFEKVKGYRIQPDYLLVPEKKKKYIFRINILHLLLFIAFSNFINNSLLFVDHPLTFFLFSIFC